jgi:YbgC/YbaW family acyl-CoA thioester hydrolase
VSLRETITWNDISGARVGRFGRRVNTTSILWRLGSTLVDTGPPNQWASVRAFVEAGTISQVVVTHHHEDHAGNLARFRALGIERLLAPSISLQLLRNGFPLQMYRRIVWGRPRRVDAEAFEDTIALPEGGELEAICLPGHSPDMTCLLDRKRGVLFGADVYVGRHLKYLRRDENLNGIIAGLERLLPLDFGTLLCSHRGIVPSARQRLREKLDYLIDLRERATSLDRRSQSVSEITQRLLGPEDLITRLSRGHFSKRNLILACLDPEGLVRPPGARWREFDRLGGVEETSSAPVFVYRRRIDFADTDVGGIVHFSRFLVFMEAAEHEMLRARGLSVRMKSGGRVVGWPRGEVTCRYFAPARFGDEVEVEVFVERRGARSMTYGFRIRRHTDLLAEGRMTSVCCELSPEHPPRSIPIPESILSRLPP